MANEESVLREVDEELAHERQWAFFRKHGSALISAAAAIVLFVGGWQFYTYSKAEAGRQSALEYAEALKLLEQDEAGGLAALSAVIDGASGGYPALARLQQGAALARSGDRAAALAAYRAAADDGRASKRLHELAQLRAAYLLLEDGRDAVLTELGPLIDAPTPLGYYARELLAVAALEAEDYDAAMTMFRRASIDLAAPEPLRQRAEELAALAAAGKAGVNISGKVRTQDLLRAIGEDEAVDEKEAEPSSEDENSATVSETAGEESEPVEAEDAGPGEGENNDASENE